MKTNVQKDIPNKNQNFVDNKVMYYLLDTHQFILVSFDATSLEKNRNFVQHVLNRKMYYSKS